MFQLFSLKSVVEFIFLILAFFFFSFNKEKFIEEMQIESKVWEDFVVFCYMNSILDEKENIE